MPMNKMMDWDIFMSSECHRLKSLGDFDYIEKTLTRDIIRQYWNDHEYACAFYVLAMIDYLCSAYAADPRENRTIVIVQTEK